MYRTTKEENEMLTRVGRGTPMGELLRRYWWPVGISAHLKEKPTFIRLLGEDLVLFRDGQGRAGVVGSVMFPSPGESVSWKCGEAGTAMPVSRVVIRHRRKSFADAGRTAREQTKRWRSSPGVSGRGARRIGICLPRPETRAPYPAIRFSRGRRKKGSDGDGIWQLQLAAMCRERV